MMLALAIAIFGFPMPGISLMGGATGIVDVQAATVTDKVPAQAYMKNSSGRLYTYTSSSLSVRTGYIEPGDRCKITAFYSNGAVKVSYPTKSRTRTAYASMGGFLGSTEFSTSTTTLGKRLTAYRRSTGSATIGTVYATDQVTIISKSSGRTQVIYPCSGGYKIGWVQGSYSIGNNPVGYLDEVSSPSEGNLFLGGWVYDKDDLNSSIWLHIYVGGAAGTGVPVYFVQANAYRPDVHNAYGVGNYHGFHNTLSVTPRGEKTVYVYAINIGSGENVLIGKKNVNLGGGSSGDSGGTSTARSTVVSYMNSMASIAWTPANSFKHWSYGKTGGNNHIWRAGTTYYGIPYSQSNRNTTLEAFKANLSESTYVGPAGQSTYMGNDCSSAVSIAYRQVNGAFPITNTTGLYPVKGMTRKVGSYNDYNLQSASTICTRNGQAVMINSYKSLQPGDLLLRSGHVMMVTSVGANSVKVTHQTTYNSSLRSTWRINETWSFTSLYSGRHIPVTMAAW